MSRINRIFIDKDPTWAISSSYSLRKMIEELRPWSYELSIKKNIKIRSTEQNSWYWTILHFLAENSWVWYTDDEWHEVFKSFFLKEDKTIPNTNCTYSVINSTKDLDTLEFIEYIQKILTFCEIELNISRKHLLPPIKSTDYGV